MGQANGISKIAGLAAPLMTAVGLLLFFFGICGPTRTFLFVGVALIALSFVAYFVEEFGPRR